MYKVFLVDDEELMLKELEETVSWLDYGFTVVGKETDPARAIDAVRELRPHVVISDLKMPHLDGHEFMKTVREEGLEPEFVMLSAYGTFEDARTFFTREGFDYILKPLNPDEMALVLERLSRRLSQKYPVQTEEHEYNQGFASLIDYVSTHFTEKFSLDSLGRQFGLSPNYICALFSKYYNTSFSSYTTKLRMEHAKTLIANTAESLKNIAEKCGYSDYFYFNKVFKNYFELSPTQYREQMSGTAVN